MALPLLLTETDRWIAYSEGSSYSMGVPVT